MSIRLGDLLAICTVWMQDSDEKTGTTLAWILRGRNFVLKDSVRRIYIYIRSCSNFFEFVLIYFFILKYFD